MSLSPVHAYVLAKEHGTPATGDAADCDALLVAVAVHAEIDVQDVLASP